MNINEIDTLLEESIIKFNEYIFSKLNIKQISTEKYFIKYGNQILELVNEFNNTFMYEKLKNIQNDEISKIINITFTRYYIFYIFLSIGYYYTFDISLYITNILEIIKEYKSSKNNLNDFFDSTSNGILFNTYDNIKKNLVLISLGNLNKIKEYLQLNKNKYKSVYDFFHMIGENNYSKLFIENELTSYSLIYTIIIYTIYMQDDKKYIIENIKLSLDKNIKYRYIEIITRLTGFFDYNVVTNILKILKINDNDIDEIYDYINDNINKIDYINNVNDYIYFLFDTKLFVPITHEFIRFHKSSYNSNTEEVRNLNYTLDKINKFKRYYTDIKNLSYLSFSQLFPQLAIIYNMYEDIILYNKLDKANNNIQIYDFKNIMWNTYINFNELSIRNIKIRVKNTTEAIQYHNFENKTDSKLYLRCLNNNISADMVGLVYNPYKLLLSSCTTSILHIAITKSYEFINLLNNNNLEKKLYYIIFNDMETDNINELIHNLYNAYYEITISKLKYKILKVSLNSLTAINNIIEMFNNHFIENISNDILLKIFTKINKTININTINIINNKNIKFKKLPFIKIESNETDLIILNEDNSKDYLSINDNNKSICYHYRLWNQINNIPKNNDNYNQEIFEFVKQYVKLNSDGKYICKSCSETLYLEKYVISGTYVEELDQFLTTELIIHTDLDNIEKYTKYKTAIQHIDKLIERLGNLSNIFILVGNSQPSKLKRRIIVRNIIDIVTLHFNYLHDNSSKFINNKQNSILFFFYITDSIFLKSQSDIDKYKTIKYNNILLYILLFILLDVDKNQFLNLKTDKYYNHIIFEQIYRPLFGNLFIMINNETKLPLISCMPLMYLLYYMSGIMITYKIWLTTNEVSAKESFNIQKIICISFIELINSIVQAKYENENYLYTMLYSRIFDKLKSLFLDNALFETYKIYNKNIKLVNNKLILSTNIKEDIYIDISNCFKQNIFSQQNKKIGVIINTPLIIPKKYITLSNTLTSVTTCDSGFFHTWVYSDKSLYSPSCNLKYNEIKHIDSKILIKNAINRHYERNYLLNTELITNNSIIDNNKIIKYIKQIKEIRYSEYLNFFNYAFKYNENMKNKIMKETLIYKDLINDYPDDILKYINKTVSNITNILGNNINVNTINIHPTENRYFIEHDFLGKKISPPIIITEDKISIEDSNILIYDSKNKLSMSYNIYTNIYNGFIKDNVYNNYKGNIVKIQIIYSLEKTIQMLGSMYKYYNVGNNITIEIISNIIRDKLLKLKRILNIIIKELYNITKSSKNETIYFNDIDILYNNISTLKIKIDVNKLNIFNGFLDSSQLIKFNNSDSYIIYYILKKLNYIIKNSRPNIVNAFIVNLVSESYNNFENFENMSSKMLNIDYSDILDINVQVVGVYNELMDQNEINEMNEKLQNEEKYEDAIDVYGIEDYDNDDDIDNRYEALDGYE